MDINSLFAIIFLIVALGIVALKGLKYQKEWAAYSSRPLRQKITELEEENITLKRKYAGLQGKYSQLKENFDLAAQDFEEQAAGGATPEITPELIQNISTLSPDAILSDEFLSSIGINPTLLKIPMVKSFITNFIESGGLQKIADKLKGGATEQQQAAALPNKEGALKYL